MEIRTRKRKPSRRRVTWLRRRPDQRATSMDKGSRLLVAIIVPMARTHRYYGHRHIKRRNGKRNFKTRNPYDKHPGAIPLFLRLDTYKESNCLDTSSLTSKQKYLNSRANTRQGARSRPRPLKVEELNRAEKAILKIVQESHFQTELSTLKSMQSTKINSRMNVKGKGK